MNKLERLITTFFLTLPLATGQAAADEKPLDLIQDATENLLVALQESPDLRTNIDGLRRLAEKIVLPHVDLAGLSRLTLGKYWRRATPEQRARFADEFRRLLVRTYANSLVEYENQSVDCQLLTLSEDNRHSTVRTHIEGSGHSALLIDYRLRRAENGWKIYDVMIEGVSLAVTYRATFSKEIRRGGIEGLIESLRHATPMVSKPEPVLLG
jgi:phospholipid transport system substrate-binding protein